MNRQEATDAILSIIRSYESMPYGPTRRDISNATGVPLGVVQAIVVGLANDGRIWYSEGIARSIRLRKDDS